MLRGYLNGQRLGAKETKRENKHISTDRLKSHSVSGQGKKAETERRHKTKRERESMCTQKDLRDSSKTLLFVPVVLRLDLSSHL